MSIGEFSLIEKFFTQRGEEGAIELGIGDDAAALRVPDGHVLQVSTDTAIGGVHFPRDLPPADIAYRHVANQLFQAHLPCVDFLLHLPLISRSDSHEYRHSG